jgi:hypothetical protein
MEDVGGALTLLMNVVGPVLLGAALIWAIYYTSRRRREGESILAGVAVLAAIVAFAIGLFLWGLAPEGSPNSGSTSTSADVDPATTVAPKDRKPGIDWDGR